MEKVRDEFSLPCKVYERVVIPEFQEDLEAEENGMETEGQSRNSKKETRTVSTKEKRLSTNENEYRGKNQSIVIQDSNYVLKRARSSQSSITSPEVLQIPTIDNKDFNDWMNPSYNKKNHDLKQTTLLNHFKKPS